jgi:hypothetical protein
VVALVIVAYDHSSSNEAISRKLQSKLYAMPCIVQNWQYQIFAISAKISIWRNAVFELGYKEV